MKNISAKVLKYSLLTVIIGAAALITAVVISVVGNIIYFVTAADMPKPKVKNGEFQCKLVYEVNGEQKVIEDTIVCKYKGYRFVGENGRYREWEKYMKSTGKDMISLYDVRENNDYTDWGNQILELYFFVGNAEYYMGDTGLNAHEAKEGNIGEEIDYVYLTPEGKEGRSAFKADEAWEKYKIRIISWETSPPIQNTFE